MSSFDDWLESLEDAEWEVVCKKDEEIISDEPRPYDGFNFWNTDIDNHFPTAINQRLLCTSNHWGDYDMYRICSLQPIECLINCVFIDEEREIV